MILGESELLSVMRVQQVLHSEGLTFIETYRDWQRRKDPDGNPPPAIGEVA
jgi:hypothetical protein